jgi:hypothetical protein
MNAIEVRPLSIVCHIKHHRGQPLSIARHLQRHGNTSNQDRERTTEVESHTNRPCRITCGLLENIGEKLALLLLALIEVVLEVGGHGVVPISLSALIQGRNMIQNIPVRCSGEGQNAIGRSNALRHVLARLLVLDQGIDHGRPFWRRGLGRLVGRDGVDDGLCNLRVLGGVGRGEALGAGGDDEVGEGGGAEGEERAGEEGGELHGCGGVIGIWD